MDCKEIRPLLEMFLDGELEATQTLQVEAHVEDCERCREEHLFGRALKQEIRSAVGADAAPTEDFQLRLQSAFRAEQQREEQRDQTRQVVPLGWKTILPMVAAAAALVVYTGVQGNHEGASSSAPATSQANVADVSFEQALDRLIDNHSSPPQFQVTQQELLPAFEPNVGVRVRLPKLSQYGAKWEGASLVAVRDHAAASLRYKMPGHRVTVYVYDPRKVKVHHHLKPRILRNKPIYVGQWRGYSVAAKENRGVGYALAADLDDAAISELITAIH